LYRLPVTGLSAEVGPWQTLWKRHRRWSTDGTHQRIFEHVTVYRWVQRFTPLLIDVARPSRHAPGDRWFVDET
jgi:transposase